jgi:predicted transcriptional regulator
MNELLWFLFAGTRGGETRARIVDRIRKTPGNAHKISKDLTLDYKTVQYHLNMLTENNILSVVKKGSYGAVYFISEYMQANIEVFDGIWKGFGYK